jgi:hypothetical protein
MADGSGFCIECGEAALVQNQYRFAEKSDELEGVVIPELCGYAGVRPLPARRLKDGAAVEIVAPPDHTKPPKPQTTRTPEATEVSGEEGERLEALAGTSAIGLDDVVPVVDRHFIAGLLA